MKKTSHILKILLSAFALTLLCSCANPVIFESLGNAGAEKGEPRNPHDVEIFVTNRPPWKYVELGTLSFNSGFVSSADAGIFERFRERAAELGADGVIMLQVTNNLRTVGSTVFDHWGNPIFMETPATQTIHRGVAIRKISE